MEVIDAFEEDDIQVGISPIGRLLVILLGVIGLVFFLDPRATTFDYRVGGIIAIAIPISFVSGKLQRWEDEGELPKTFLLALIGAALVSIMVTIVYTIPFQDAFTFSTILTLGLPPIFEELVFRVGVFLAFQEVTGTTLAIFLQAGLFSLYHFIFWEASAQYAFVLFFGGVVFQIIFLLSRNILCSMIAHAIVNLKPFIFAILLSPFMILAVGMSLLIVLWRRTRNGE